MVRLDSYTLQRAISFPPPKVLSSTELTAARFASLGVIRI